MVSRTTDDYQAMALAGCAAICEPAFWAGFDRKTADGFYDYFCQLTQHEPKRAAKYGLPHYCWLCINPKESEDMKLADDVLALIPEFMKAKTVLGIGEIGLNKNTRNEMLILEKHVELAVKYDQLILVHTPHLEDKRKGTRLIMDVIKAAGKVKPERVIIDHVEEHTIGEVLDQGFWAGITLYPEDATTVDALLKNADQAMYAAKHKGRNGYHYFTQSMQQAAQSKLLLLKDLRKALAKKQFRVYYQPIVDLHTNEIHKAEALIRWEHPERGLIGPVDFISLAEETGLIIDIGEWVFQQAIEQVGVWRKTHHAGFQISVNKSPVQFHSKTDKRPSWTMHLDTLALPGQSIVVEITEGLLLSTGSIVTNRLQEFHEAGIQVSLDDFGTGYSSLSYLNKFDIDYLKIDQSFVRNLAPGSSNMALCEAIIVMAHKLGMKVIAEGVETIQQRDLLVMAGCDYGQGFLYSQPVPAEKFEALLNQQKPTAQPLLA